MNVCPLAGKAFLAVFLLSCRALAGNLIGDVTTDLAMYSPGTPVVISVNLTNKTGPTFSGKVEVSVFHLGHLIATLPLLSISNLAPGAALSRTFSWMPPVMDYQGYLVSVTASDLGGAIDSVGTAVDVSSDWARFPRYGYLSHFDAGLNTTQLVSQLKNYHVNGLQFYDWQWKHHIPYSPNTSWQDIANRIIVRRTLTNFITAAHTFNMLAMNYNLYGGAYDNYLSDGSGLQLSVGIFSGPRPASGYSLTNQLNVSLPSGWATTRLYQMNNRDLAWQNYIFARELTVFDKFPFDGFHIDSLGTHSAYDYSGSFFSLDDHNPAFINNAKAVLKKRMVFNTVDAGGESQIAQSANVDFVYSELWDGNANYQDFNRRVDNVRKYAAKSVVFAAYLNRGLNSGTFNEPGVRLANAAIFASGASHLELGGGDRMLHVEYFPNDVSVIMTSSLKTAMRSYYDFLVAYENLLRDGTVSANHRVTITGVPTSTNGSAGAVWIIPKKNAGFGMAHLVNLANNPSSLWRDNSGTYPAPLSFTNLAIKMYYAGSIGSGRLWCATPDLNSGAATSLDFTPGSDALGTYLTFTLPRLQYWDMIWLELNGTRSAAKITASNYDSMAAIDLEATSDTGGGFDVCCVNNTTGGSYVAFNNVDFALGALDLSARVASALDSGTIEFRVGSPSGPLIATVPVGNTGGWQTWKTVTVPVSEVSGVHAVYAVFKAAPSNLNWFQLTLTTTNRTPVPSPIPAQTIIAGATLTITNSAWDPDLPSQTLTWNVMSGPSGVALDPLTGVFSWRPTLPQAPSTQDICLAVSDNGTPPLNATQCFTITVSPPARPSIALLPSTNAPIMLQVSGDAGPDYTIQTSTNLLDWSGVFTTNSPALPFLWNDSEPPSHAARFYRVQLGP